MNPDMPMKVRDIDWDSWTPEMVATLMFVMRADEVLLIRKKRGIGAGKINGPGGRIELGETPLECAVRETEEELHIRPRNVLSAGELFFHAEDEMPRIHAYLFTATGYDGEPIETDEAIPLWTPINALPFDEMWDDDRLWLPAVLAGKTVRAWFTFVGETLIDDVVRITPAH
jgi:8-oxo-dGTP diphosphatase